MTIDSFTQDLIDSKAAKRLKQYRELIDSDLGWYYQPMMHKLVQNLSWDLFDTLLEELDEESAVLLVLTVYKLTKMDVCQMVAKAIHPLDVDKFGYKCFPELYTPMIDQDWYID